MQKKEALWQGRFESSPDAAAIAFETSIHVDTRLVFDDIRGSIAHVNMLGKQKIITQAEADAIVVELKNIEQQIRGGKLSIDESAEDIHSFIEGVLTERLGDTGRKVHTGRSRNDQIALAERLYLKHAIPDLQKKIGNLIGVLTDIAQNHTKTFMSGYTHVQRAQPVTLALHLCAWAQMLVRDHWRLSDALMRLDFSPLGAGALAGSGLALNRETVAEELGFLGVTANSLDTVSDRDYCIEIASALAILMMHLSRFCEEVVLWSTEEFKFINLSENWSTGSSIMPQKKNPDFAELIRGRTGKVYGNLIALLTMMKALPLSYNRDMQEDKESLFAAYDTAFSCISVFTHMISSAQWNVQKMRDSCLGGFSNATDLADYLVKKGMPFRTAHSVAAKAVRVCIERGIQLEELSLSDFKNCSSIIENDVFESLKIENCVNARKTTGGPNEECVYGQIEKLRNFIKTCADS